jgi:hypothetical protein
MVGRTRFADSAATSASRILLSVSAYTVPPLSTVRLALASRAWNPPIVPLETAVYGKIEPQSITFLLGGTDKRFPLIGG